jgi:hypothetical protein
MAPIRNASRKCEVLDQYLGLRNPTAMFGKGYVERGIKMQTPEFLDCRRGGVPSGEEWIDKWFD